MKKMYFLKDSLLGGCLGLIITGIAFYIYRIINEGFSQELQQNLIIHVIEFLAFAFWFGLFSVIRHKMNDKKNIEEINRERKENLKGSRKYLIVLLIVTLIGGIVSLILKAQFLITLAIFVISTALLILVLGTHIGYISLKNNIDSINKKLNEMNNK